MNLSDFEYYEDEDCQAVNLYYGKLKNFVATIILPNKNTNIQSFVSCLDNKKFDQLLSKKSKREGTVLIPRFKVEFDTLLNETMLALGVSRIFKGPLTKMSKCDSGDDESRVDRIIHKVVVIVNEEGTEAAAVTAIEACLESFVPKPFYMRCDRPFLFTIKEHKTDTLLFLGRIDNPDNPE